MSLSGFFRRLPQMYRDVLTLSLQRNIVGKRDGYYRTKVMVDLGANPHATILGFNALHLASAAAKPKTVEALVKYVDPNDPTSCYEPAQTCLQLAAAPVPPLSFRGHDEYCDSKEKTVGTLLRAGADPNKVPNKDIKFSPLYRALKGNMTSVAKLLLKWGARVDKNLVPFTDDESVQDLIQSQLEKQEQIEKIDKVIEVFSQLGINPEPFTCEEAYQLAMQFSAKDEAKAKAKGQACASNDNNNNVSQPTSQETSERIMKTPPKA